MTPNRGAFPEMASQDISPREDADAGLFVGPDQPAAVAVIIVTFNSAGHISDLIADLRLEARDLPLRVIVVDNQSRDDTLSLVRQHADLICIESGGNLGFAGGINVGVRSAGVAKAVLILNPDLRLRRGAVSALLSCAEGDDTIGAVVPMMLNEDGTLYPSLRREPSIVRATRRAVLGTKFPRWVSSTSEFVLDPASYGHPHDIDWAGGAAELITSEAASEVGDWWEGYPIYSEETDYFRRIRESGRRVRFEPAAAVLHSGGGSGSSPGLYALMAVNRIRYIRRYHGSLYTAVFRSVVVLTELLRSRNPVSRYALSVLVARRRWTELPAITKPVPSAQLAGPKQRGSVIVPACNESARISRTLTPLSEAAVDGYIEVIVVCNGCTDTTAEVARAVPGVRVVELEEPSKPAALNAGDQAAAWWPRLYLDADIAISAETVLAVLDRLRQGDLLAARPQAHYDTESSSILVRSYYRARTRVVGSRPVMWGAGVYGLSEAAHRRFGRFPDITGDDLFVDLQFSDAEKGVLPVSPVVVHAPRDTGSLLKIMRRGMRGNVELLGAKGNNTAGLRSAVAALRTARGISEAADALVYLCLSAARRTRWRGGPAWGRDDSSRSVT